MPTYSFEQLLLACLNTSYVTDTMNAINPVEKAVLANAFIGKAALVSSCYMFAFVEDTPEYKEAKLKFVDFVFRPAVELFENATDKNTVIETITNFMRECKEKYDNGTPYSEVK